MQIRLSFPFITVAKKTIKHLGINLIRDIRPIKGNLQYPIKRQKTIYEQMER